MYSDSTLDYYTKNASSFIDSTRDVEFSSNQDKFISVVKSVFVTENADISLLDFGCGSGRDTKYFLQKGFNVDAIDGCEELCKAASDFAGIEVKQALFQEWKAEKNYEGIWACSSILHLSKQDLAEVLVKLSNSLSEKGILYTSFKYGDFEGERNGRYFIDFTEQKFDELLSEINCFNKLETWVTGDVRKGRENEKWLNLLLQKK